MLIDLTRFYWVSLGFTGFYWVLLGFTGFYCGLLCLIGFYLGSVGGGNVQRHVQSGGLAK